MSAITLAAAAGYRHRAYAARGIGERSNIEKGIADSEPDSAVFMVAAAVIQRRQAFLYHDLGRA